MTKARRSPPDDSCSHEPHKHQPSAPAVIERAAALFRCAGDESRLRLLRADGLVSRRRDGKHMYYQLADDHVRAILRMGLNHAAEDL